MMCKCVVSENWSIFCANYKQAKTSSYTINSLNVMSSLPGGTTNFGQLPSSMFHLIALKRFYGMIIGAQRLVHGLQTNGVATALEVTPLQGILGMATSISLFTRAGR